MANGMELDLIGFSGAWGVKSVPQTPAVSCKTMDHPGGSEMEAVLYSRTSFRLSKDSFRLSRTSFMLSKKSCRPSHMRFRQSKMSSQSL